MLYWSIYERDICRFENASGFLQHQIESLEKLLRIFSNITESQGGNFAKDKQSRASISYFKISSALFFFLVCAALYIPKRWTKYFIFSCITIQNYVFVMMFQSDLIHIAFCSILYWGSSLAVKQRLTIRWFDMASIWPTHQPPSHIPLYYVNWQNILPLHHEPACQCQIPQLWHPPFIYDSKILRSKSSYLFLQLFLP